METFERDHTDPRLDDLREKVGDRFAKIEADIQQLRDDMGFGSLDKRFKRVDAEFVRLGDKFDKRIDRVWWAMLGTMYSAIIVLLIIASCLWLAALFS